MVQQSEAQDKAQKFFEISYDQGPIIGNNKDWADELIDRISYAAVDLRMGWRSPKSTVYNYVNRYPSYGIGFTSNLKYYSEIGRPMAIYGFGEFPFGKESYLKKLNFSYYAQVGLGFGMNPYDAESNALNGFVGTGMNIHVGVGFKGFYQLAETVGIFASAGLKHYSNGSIKKPNSGINFVPIALGVRLKMGQEPFSPVAKPEFPQKDYKGYWNIAAYAGAKSYEIGEKAYFRGGLGVNYLWDFSYKYKAGIGIDWFYGAGASERYPTEDVKFTDINSFAVVGSWEWQLTERFYMPIAFGVYLSKAHYNQEAAQYYERIGVRYRAKNNLFAGLQIKAHKAKADFFEFTFGYTIPGGKR
ncbi:acyloxyacyl hydrolase [Algoriphagus halophytocola]|uniref:Acyloxyacyl hydrolase n=1 Tax=Algoriphagus halophytocola TaxID=2991499 RepID=A0ABY6MM84_9BACT|nr:MULTISPECIES: acyloxyacyl hydrolase [unclassified Algoriphagus]UZD23791.1 acyloxyacyl hydrolase [Algoriphagus sp. TR-M5]WBL45085.1 acyloxyacyl hydrolase [Algoriphagus sp. TR-M9]